MEKVVEHLRALGLSDKEARCYTALVELGEGTAYVVAEKAKLKRPIVYVVLDELRQKGLVLKVPHRKKQLFIAKPPQELFAAFDERARYAKRALPELLAMARDKQKVRVLYYEGKEGMRDAIGYKLPALAGKEVVAFYGKGKGPVPAIYFEYNKALYEQRSKIRGLAPKHPSLREFRALDKKYGWDIRSLDESEFSSEVSVEVGDDFVRLLLYKDAQAVIVENKDFARMMREVFEMVWKSRKATAPRPR